MTDSAATVDVVAQAIRVVDGKHDLGAGALAEALVAELSRQGYAITREALCARAGGCGA